MRSSIFPKNASDEYKKEVKQSFLAGQLFRRELERVIMSKIETANHTSESTERYSEPAFAERQADLVGYKRACREILEILIDKNGKSDNIES